MSKKDKDTKKSRRAQDAAPMDPPAHAKRPAGGRDASPF